MTVDTVFLDKLASSEPTPGGGGAAAYAGALAAALASMVGNLTVGKPRYADVEAETAERLAALEELRAQLVDLVDADARAFEPIGRAYRMPNQTGAEQQARHDAIQAALAGACEVPLDCMRACLQAIDAAAFMAEHGNRTALTDAAAAALLAKAALQAASLNIYINAEAMDDRAQAERLVAEADRLFKEGAARADAAYNAVAAGLGAPEVHEAVSVNPREGGDA